MNVDFFSRARWPRFFRIEPFTEEERRLVELAEWPTELDLDVDDGEQTEEETDGSN